MIIYGALLIPIITAFFLYKYFHHKTVWWEFFIPFLSSLAFIVSMKAIIETVQVSCDEYWGSFVSRVEYYEDWNEYIHQTCTGSCGENCTYTYDCSFVVYHPARWEIVTTTQERLDITWNEYQRIKSKFNNEGFWELHRNYYTDDGDAYYSVWPQDSITSVPITTVHTYENRIKVADQSVFHFGKITELDKKKYAIKEYPEIKRHTMQSVIGDSTSWAELTDKRFQYLNALLGHKKEVRLFVLLFHNQPIEAANYQEWYWSGGNMNEFIVCIGLDKEKKVAWCKPISWTRNETLKAEVKQFVQAQSSLNLTALCGFLREKIDKGFIRRDFKEFDYLTVEPPVWAVILTYILTIAINFGVSYWIIRNEHCE